MNQEELVAILGDIIAEATTAVLATTGKDGLPHMRWMTPLLPRDRPGTILSMTSAKSVKLVDLTDNPHGEWMFQTRSLTKVVNVPVTIRLVDNPSLRSEVMEALGARLGTFWKINADKMDFLVLESGMREARYLEPMKGIRHVVRFGEA